MINTAALQIARNALRANHRLLVRVQAHRAAITALNRQTNAILAHINASPTPNQVTIGQLQAATQEFTSLLALDSAITKSIQDAQKTIISNISS